MPAEPPTNNEGGCVKSSSLSAKRLLKQQNSMNLPIAKDLDTDRSCGGAGLPSCSRGSWNKPPAQEMTSERLVFEVA